MRLMWWEEQTSGTAKQSKAEQDCTLGTQGHMFISQCTFILSQVIFVWCRLRYVCKSHIIIIQRYFRFLSQYPIYFVCFCLDSFASFEKQFVCTMCSLYKLYKQTGFLSVQSRYTLHIYRVHFEHFRESWFLWKLDASNISQPKSNMTKMK